MEQQSTPKLRNRRSSLRAIPRSSVKVECRRGSTGLGANLAASFLDLSEGGLRLIVKVPLKVQDEVEILLAGFGMRQTIKRFANVAWALPLEDGQTCVGLQFQKRLPYQEVAQFSRR